MEQHTGDFNFLLKCESATYGQNWSTIDTPEMFGIIKVARKFEREMEQNCFQHQKETFEDALSGYVDRKEAPSKRRQLKTSGYSKGEGWKIKGCLLSLSK